jgi:hypothetical protein
MLKCLYEHVGDNKNNYDDVREYCMAEHLNEAYFRTSITKNGLRGKPAMLTLLKIKRILRTFTMSIGIRKQRQAF